MFTGNYFIFNCISPIVINIFTFSIDFTTLAEVFEINPCRFVNISTQPLRTRMDNHENDIYSKLPLYPSRI